MGRETWSDFSVQIRRKRWRCIPDPQLCLSKQGGPFLSALVPHSDVCLTPEFLSWLDGFEHYLRQPHLLSEPLRGACAHDEIRDALRMWLQIRDETGARGGRLYWVRDCLRESCLPADVDESIVSRWEAIAEALDERLSGAGEFGNPIAAVRRDAAALSVALPGSLLLTARETPRGAQGRRHGEVGRGGSLIDYLQSWGVPCAQVSGEDELAALERRLLLQMLVEAGLAAYLWADLGLCVVHLVAPGAARLPYASDGPAPAPDFDADAEPRPVKSVWEDARAFWYELAPEASHVRS
jgi:hypothetical protein